MKKMKQDYLFHVDNDIYRGVLTKENLLAAKESNITSLQKVNYENVPTISPDLSLEAVLTQSMNCDYSLPVVNKKGKLQGKLEKSFISNIFNTENQFNTLIPKFA